MARGVNERRPSVNERRPSVNERRPTVSWARKRGVRRGLGARGRARGARVPWRGLLAPRRRSRAEVDILLRWPSGGADGLEVMRQALGTQEAREALLVEDRRHVLHAVATRARERVALSPDDSSVPSCAERMARRRCCHPARHLDGGRPAHGGLVRRQSLRWQSLRWLPLLRLLGLPLLRQLW